MGNAVGAQIMDDVVRGHVRTRSADVFLIPRPYSYLVGDWDLTSLGTSRPWTATTHPVPWAYTARIPLILYGHGYIPAGRRPYDHVDAADLAPTYARLIGMRGFRREGHPLPGIGVHSHRPPPRAIVTVVMDGGGWNALQEHNSSWPTIRRLAARGTSYANATNGSAPSITGAIHATFGTGDYPETHGIPGNQLRAPDGSIPDSWRENADPRYLRVPTLTDLWDRAHNNKPVAAAVAYEGWHLGMLGHGSFLGGGDKDIAAIWDVEDQKWWINQSFYKLPSYLQPTDLDRLSKYEDDLDPRDGERDGTWFGHTLEQLREPTARPGTPAFARFTGDAASDVLNNEPFGKDKITDFLWVEFKTPDYAGHAWNMLYPEEGDVLREVDAQIGRLKHELDKRLGRRRYVLAISADHGQQPLPDLLGGWRIDTPELQNDIESRFGSIVKKITTTDIYMDLDQVEEDGVNLDDVARYLGTYTVGDNVPDNAPGADHVPASMLDQRIFAGAFSAHYIESLTPYRIRIFGASDYQQGALTISRPQEQGG